MLAVPFVVRSASADESGLPGEAPGAYLERVSRAKLDAVRALGLGPVGGILVADTIVVAPDGAILGKPRDDGDAHAMLARLAGATHEVSTRFLLADSQAGSPPLHAQTVATRVTFRPLTGPELTALVASGEGRDKAGAYALQGRAAAFAERIEGSYTSVVGLPLSEVVVAMRALGWL